MHSVKSVTKYCGRAVLSMVNNLRTTMVSFTHHPQIRIKTFFKTFLSTYFTPAYHPTLHTSFLKNISVIYNFYTPSTGPTKTTTYIK